MTHEQESPDEHATRRSIPPRYDLNRVVDRGPLGFVITNKAGVIEWINATLLLWLGYDGEQVIGHKTFQELLSPGGRIYYDTHVRPLVHMQHVANEIALELVRADRSRLPVLVNSTLRVDDLTGDETIETFLVDATRRRQYETELLRERQLAERAEARLQLMYDIVSGLAEAKSVDDIVDIVTARASHSTSGARCSIWFLEEGERAVARVGASTESGAHHPDTLDFPEGGPALDQLASGHLVVVNDRRDAEHTYPLICQWMADGGLHSAAIAPLITDGSWYGALSFGYEDPHDFDEAELRSVRSLAAQTEQGLDRVRVHQVDRRNRELLESLLEFTMVLSSASTLNEVIDAMVDRGQQLLGAVGSRVALLDNSGTSVWFVHGRGSGEQLGIHLPLDRRSIGCEAIRTNELVVVDSRQELEELFPDSPILDHPSFGRVMSMPLRRGDEILGAWILVGHESGSSDAIDVTMFELFAEQAGQATQRAALHEAEAEARAQADIRNHVSAALNRAVTTSDVGRAITFQGRAAFGAATLVFLVVDPDDSSSLRLETYSGLDDDVIVGASAVPIDQRLTGLLTGPPAPQFAVGKSEFDDLLDVVIGTNRRGPAALLPLGVAGHQLGLIVIGFARPDALTSTMRVALSGLAGEANVALVRARRFDLDHSVAEALQQGLLPSIGRVGSDWTLSTSYRPWSELLEVGGDLFDVTPFDDGRLVLVVGDVVGHGLAAAAAMGLLRSAAKMLTLVARSPAEVIAGLHKFARATPTVMYASVCCVEVQSDGTGRYACAGHPFPVVRHCGGQTEVLDEGRSPLLGLNDGEPADSSFVMPIGSSIVVYTDGLIERKNVPSDAGVDRLREYLSGVGDSPGEVSADDIVRAMLDDQHHDDDVVAVCLTRVDADGAD